MSLARWKLAMTGILRRLGAVGHKASAKQNKEFCKLYIDVISNAMYTVARRKGDAILMTSEYANHFRTLEAQKTRLANRAITNVELRDIRDALTKLQVSFIADSATQGVNLPTELEALMREIERMPEGESVPEPYPPLPSPVPVHMQLGRASQDIPMPPPPPPMRDRTVSEYGATGRPAYHHAYAAPHQPAQPAQQAPGAAYVPFQRGHARTDTFGGNQFGAPPRVSTDRSSTSSGRSQAPMPSVASPYNPGGPAFASMVDLPVDSYDTDANPNSVAYQQMLQQGWRPSFSDQGRPYYR